MQTSGLVLDVFDDSDGRVLRGLFPTIESVPDLVKEAQHLGPEDLERLPDDLFALVMRNGDDVLRKYACIDAGNTALSVVYFVANADKLPEEAQKIAAQNLITACGWYELDVPEELEKRALNPLSVLTAVPTVVGTAGAIKGNMQAVKSAPGALLSPNQMRQMGKMGELSGSVLMPAAATAGASPPKVVKKTASLDPYVDVTRLEAPARTEKVASVYALGDKYPLNSYEQVKTAAEYFEDFAHHFTPADRRAYSVALVKRASELAISVGELARRYGAEGYAPDLKVAQDMRAMLVSEEARAELQDLFAKTASVTPEQFCQELGQFDVKHGLAYHYDSHVADPYYSVYGSKEASEETGSFSETIGNEFVSERALRALAKVAPVLQPTFTEDFTKEFAKDPVGIYKSLPRDQRLVLMRLANDNNP